VKESHCPQLPDIGSHQDEKVGKRRKLLFFNKYKQLQASLRTKGSGVRISSGAPQYKKADSSMESAFFHFIA